MIQLPIIGEVCLTNPSRMIDYIGMLRELLIFLLISVPAAILLCKGLYAIIGTICEAVEIENRVDKNA